MKLKNKNLVPPEPGFEYKQYETGFVCNGKSLQGTIDLVLKHRQGNNLPRATEEEVAKDVEDQICKRLGFEWCSDVKWAFSDSWDKIKAGTKTLMLWATSDQPYVPQSEAERRANICKNCFARKVTSGCLSCGFINLVRTLIREACKDKTSSLDERSSCLVCECLLNCKVHIKDEILLQGTSDAQREIYREIPHCWMNEIDKVNTPK